MSGQIDGNNRNIGFADSNLHVERLALGGKNSGDSVFVITAEPYKTDSMHRNGVSKNHAAIADLLEALGNTSHTHSRGDGSHVFDDLLGDKRRDNSTPQDQQLVRALLKALSANGHGDKCDDDMKKNLLALVLIAGKMHDPKMQKTLLKALVGLEFESKGCKSNPNLEKALAVLLGGAQRGGKVRGGGGDDMGNLEQLLDLVSRMPNLSDRVRAKLQAAILQAMIRKLDSMKGMSAEYGLIRLAQMIPSLPPQLRQAVEKQLIEAIIKVMPRDKNVMMLAMLAFAVRQLSPEAQRKIQPALVDTMRGEMRAHPDSAGNLNSIARTAMPTDIRSDDMKKFLTESQGRGDASAMRSLVDGTPTLSGKKDIGAQVHGMANTPGALTEAKSLESSLDGVKENVDAMIAENTKKLNETLDSVGNASANTADSQDASATDIYTKGDKDAAKTTGDAKTADPVAAAIEKVTGLDAGTGASGSVLGSTSITSGSGSKTIENGDDAVNALARSAKTLGSSVLTNATTSPITGNTLEQDANALMRTAGGNDAVAGRDSSNTLARAGLGDNDRDRLHKAMSRVDETSATKSGDATAHRAHGTATADQASVFDFDDDDDALGDGGQSAIGSTAAILGALGSGGREAAAAA